MCVDDAYPSDDGCLVILYVFVSFVSSFSDFFGILTVCMCVCVCFFFSLLLSFCIRSASFASFSLGDSENAVKLLGFTKKKKKETDALMYWNDKIEKKKSQVLAKFGLKFNYQSHFVPQCHHSLYDGNEAVDSEA